MIVTIFITSFIIAFSGAMMPEPPLTVAISETPRRGFITGRLLITKIYFDNFRNIVDKYDGQG